MRKNIAFSFYCTFIIFFTSISYAQKSVNVKIRIVDSTSRLINGDIFEVSIKNIEFSKYPIQDTSIIKKLSSLPSSNFVSPYLEKLENGKYKQIIAYRPTGYPIPDSCVDTCCNCIFLSRKQSIKFQMKILECCDWEPGFYRIKVGIYPPLMYKGPIKLFKMQYSNFVYFTVDSSRIEPFSH